MHNGLKLSMSIAALGFGSAAFAKPLDQNQAEVFVRQALQSPASVDVKAIVLETREAKFDRAAAEAQMRKILNCPDPKEFSNDPAIRQMQERQEQAVQMNVDNQMRASKGGAVSIRYRDVGQVKRVDSVSRIDGTVPGVDTPYDYTTVVKYNKDGNAVSNMFYDRAAGISLEKPADSGVAFPQWVNDFNGIPEAARVTIKIWLALETGVPAGDLAKLPADRLVKIVVDSDGKERKARLNFDVEPCANGACGVTVARPDMPHPVLKMEFTDGNFQRLQAFDLYNPTTGQKFLSRRINAFGADNNPTSISQEEWGLDGNLLKKSEITIHNLSVGAAADKIAADEPVETVPGNFRREFIRQGRGR